MDIEHCLNVVQSNHRFMVEQGMGYDDIFDLLCALKVNNYQSMQCLTTVNVEKTVPMVMLGAAMIYDHYDRNDLEIQVSSRAERVSMGCWLLHFDNLLSKIVQPLCEGNKAFAYGMLNELFIAMLVAGYSNGAGLRKGYECAE